MPTWVYIEVLRQQFVHTLSPQLFPEELLTNARSVHLLRERLRLELAVHGHDPELVVGVRIQPVHGVVVLVQHRFRHQPLVLALDPVLDEEVRAWFALQVRLPNDPDVRLAVIVRFLFPREIGLIGDDRRAGASLLLDVVAAGMEIVIEMCEEI